MSNPFAFRDFSKKYNDLTSKNFPTLGRSKNLQDSYKFKFASKAQKGVEFDSSVTSTDGTSTEADFNGKISFEELKGAEFSFKAKNKPSTEFSAKFDDKLIPVEGLTATVKVSAAAPGDQFAGLSFGYVNKYVNLNLGATYPIEHKVFDFIASPTVNGEKTVNPLADQKTKIDFDIVAKPLETRDIYFGETASVSLAKGEEPLLYNSKFALGYNDKVYNGGVFVEHNKVAEKVTEDGKEVKKFLHKSKFGAWAFTEVEDLSGGAQVTYTPGCNTYGGFGFEVAAGIQRDADSKLSTKVQIIPETTVSFGYEQKLSKNAKLSFGYAFLLSKSSEKTKTSSYAFGLEVTH